ncbi:MAG: NAD-dependent epimerase/dehydratase family protein [Candidatus Sericytochromatia bacterium]
MKILVTGGAGYLGSTLVPALLEAGHQVTVLDNFMFQQTSLNHLCYHPDFELLRGDVRDQKLMEKLLPGFDLIVPLAALVGAPLCDRDPLAARTVILEAVEMMLGMLRPEQKLIYPTTNSGYGVGEQGIHCTEETPLRPVSLYGRLKVDAEARILSHPNAISFRLATVFGMSPRMRLDLLVNDFTYRAVNDRFIVLFEGSFKRNYIHVRDVARAFMHGIENFESMKGQSYNVGLSDANLSKRELCETIQKYLPAFVFLESEIGKDPDQRDYIVSNAKIEATGYRPVHGLELGIQELIKGYRMLRNSRYTNV